MISRFQAGMKKRSICSGVAWLSSVGRNIPKWRSKGSGLSRCTHLGQAAQSTGGEGSRQRRRWRSVGGNRGVAQVGLTARFTFIYVQTEGGRKDRRWFVINPRKRWEFRVEGKKKKRGKFQCKQARRVRTNREGLWLTCILHRWFQPIKYSLHCEGRRQRWQSSFVTCAVCFTCLLCNREVGPSAPSCENGSHWPPAC